MMPADIRMPVIPCALAAVFLISGASGSYASEGPFRLDSRREAVIIAAEAGIGILGVGIMSRVDAPDPSSLDRNDVPGFDRTALGRWSDSADRASDLTKNASVLCALFAVSYPLLNHGNDSFSPFIENLVMYAETALLVTGMTAFAKGAVHRSRPYAYNTSVPSDTRAERDAALSFWSGHASGAFAAAIFAGTVFHAREPDSKLVVPVWIGSLTAATATGVLRVRAGRHFPSDVAVAAAVGAFSGWIVPRMHRTGGDSTDISAFSNGAPGISVRHRF